MDGANLDDRINGAMLQTLIGTVLFGILSNGLNLMRINPHLQPLSIACEWR